MNLPVWRRNDVIELRLIGGMGGIVIVYLPGVLLLCMVSGLPYGHLLVDAAGIDGIAGIAVIIDVGLIPLVLLFIGGIRWPLLLFGLRKMAGAGKGVFCYHRKLDPGVLPGEKGSASFIGSGPGHGELGIAYCNADSVPGPEAPGGVVYLCGKLHRRAGGKGSLSQAGVPVSGIDERATDQRHLSVGHGEHLPLHGKLIFSF